MMSPSLAHVLVGDRTNHFVAGADNWRLAYNFKRDTYNPEARSTLTIVGALNFASYQDACEAVKILKHSEEQLSPVPHPLAATFNYEGYSYTASVDNYSIMCDVYTGVYCINKSRGVAPVGALFFTKSKADEFVIKLNRGEITL